MQIGEGDGWGFAAHVYHYWVGYSILFQIVIGQLVISALSFAPNLTMYIISSLYIIGIGLLVSTFRYFQNYPYY